MSLIYNLSLFLIMIIVIEELVVMICIVITEVVLMVAVVVVVVVTVVMIIVVLRKVMVVMVMTCCSYGRARLFCMTREMIFATKSGMTRRTNMFSEAQVRVFVAPEIFWCEKLLVALGAAKLAILRRPG